MDHSAVIGDVHGCARTLEALIHRLPSVDNLFCVGDLYDRGPNSADVFDLVKKHSIEVVKGNHEWMMQEGYQSDKPYYDTWRLNGGRQTLQSFNGSIPQEVIQHARDMPFYKIIDEYLICHAGVRKDLQLDESIIRVNSPDHDTMLSSILWCRDVIELPPYYIIHGHTPVENVNFLENSCNVDTGCVFRNKLSAILLPSRRLIQVPFLD